MKILASYLLVAHVLSAVQTVRVLSTNPKYWANNILSDSAGAFGLPFSESVEIKTILSDQAEETLIIVSHKESVLLNNGNVTVAPGKIVIAGAADCQTHCSRYSSDLKQMRNPYLDSRVVVGQGSDLLAILPDDLANLQDALSELYFSRDTRITIDHTGQLIAGLSLDAQVEIDFAESNNTLILDGMKPAIVYKPDASTSRLYGQISRYVGNGVTRTTCNSCRRVTDPSSPTLFIAVLVRKSIPFSVNLLDSIVGGQQTDKIHLVLLTPEAELSWVPPPDLAEFTHLQQDFEDEDHDSRYFLLEMFASTNAEYFIFIDSIAHITPSTIPEMLALQKPIVSPMLTLRDGTAWSNFWGSFTDSWSYQRSSDYANIFTRTVKGVFPVPCVRYAYAIQRGVALHMLQLDVYDQHVDPDISFCKTLFSENIPMYISNLHEYGWLKSTTSSPDIKLLDKENTNDWMIKYLNTTEIKEFSSPCSNVFRAESVFTENFGKDMVASVDNLGGSFTWKPKHYERPGYDLSTSSFSDSLKDLITNLTLSHIPQLYPGYTPKGELIDSWIIEVEGKKKLRRDTNLAHEAAYHVLIPLNHPQDREVGGGYRFRRLNCTVTDHKAGDIFVFPGFITHHKYDLPQTEGIHLYLEMSFDAPF